MYIMGSEIEYPTLYLPFGRFDAKRLESLRSLSLALFYKQVEADLLYAQTLGTRLGFMKNGSKIHQDQGTIEGSGPECSNPFDVSRYEAANEALLAEELRIFNAQAAQGKFNEIPPGRLEISKKGFGFFTDRSYGVHENHYLRRFGNIKSEFGVYDETREALCLPLAYFLISRIPLVGCGHLSASGDFWVSPRATMVEPVISGSATRSQSERKNMAFIRREDNSHDVDEAAYARLQVVASDANISSLQTEIKFGTTAIVLQMIAGGFLEHPPVELADLAGDFQDVGRDITLRQNLPLQNGETITALELNEEYFRSALRFFAKNPMCGWEKKIMERWEDWLEKLKNNPGALDKVLDWRILFRVLSDALEEKYGLMFVQLKDRLASEKEDIRRGAQGIIYRLQVAMLRYFFVGDTRFRESLARRGYLDESLLYHKAMLNDTACSRPPADTRAQGRFAMLKFLEDHNLLTERCRCIDWGRIAINDSGGVTRQFICKDPISLYFRDEKGQPATKLYLERFCGIDRGQLSEPEEYYG